MISKSPLYFKPTGLVFSLLPLLLAAFAFNVVSFMAPDFAQAEGCCAIHETVLSTRKLKCSISLDTGAKSQMTFKSQVISSRSRRSSYMYVQTSFDWKTGQVPFRNILKKDYNQFLTENNFAHQATISDPEGGFILSGRNEEDPGNNDFDLIQGSVALVTPYDIVFDDGSDLNLFGSSRLISKWTIEKQKAKGNFSINGDFTFKMSAYDSLLPVALEKDAVHLFRGTCTSR